LETEGSVPGSGKNVPLLTVADIDTIRVYVYVPEEETSLIKAGIPVTLRQHLPQACNGCRRHPSEKHEAAVGLVQRCTRPQK
jgi:hypothetical protein